MPLATVVTPPRAPGGRTGRQRRACVGWLMGHLLDGEGVKVM